MKRPDFLQNAALPPSLDAQPSAPRIKNVAWMPAAAEPALPRPPPTPSPMPRGSMESGFEPLPHVPHVPVAPPAPPPPQVIIQRESESLGLALEKFKAQSERLAEQARSDTLELAVIIARRILEKEINADLAAVMSLIRSAIRRAGEEHVTKVRVSQADFDGLQEKIASDFSFGKITLAADPSLERGDVMVDTEHHSIDGRIATRLEEIVRQLQGAQG